MYEGNIRMKAPFYLIVPVSLLALAACGNPDTAVTETGNPVKISLSCRARTEASGLSRRAADSSGISAITITQATLTISEAALESVSGEDSLSFESEIPYLVTIVPDGKAVLLDTLIVVARGYYEELRFEIEPAQSTLLPGLPVQMQGKSIRVEGFCDTDTTRRFVFETNMSAGIYRSFDVPVDFGGDREHCIIIEIDMNSWFSDTPGSLLDPRHAGNRERIESNIEQSFSVLEDR
jgi:hypothetical protein